MAILDAHHPCPGVVELKWPAFDLDHGHLDSHRLLARPGIPGRKAGPLAGEWPGRKWRDF
jgi:hypothetical protein